jgi:Protein of unknown function (DUF2892)
MMNSNVGTTDRVIRAVVDILILCLAFFLEGNMRWLALIGLVPLMTGVIGTCPVYSLLGMTTCAMKKT